MTVRLVLYEGVVQTYIAEHALRLVRATAREVEVAAKIAAPKDTGLLAQSIHTTAAPSGSMSATAQVGSDVYYAEIMHEGSRPHMIFPVRARALRFRTGELRMWARHPGTRRNPYLLRPLERIGREANFIVTREYRLD